MNIEQVRTYTLSLPGVTEDQPFGPENITFRLEGKIFLCLWLGAANHTAAIQPHSAMRFACKLSPQRNETLREQYTHIQPAFHWNKKHWSDICYQLLPDEMVSSLITEAYHVILNTLPKALQAKYAVMASNLTAK